jgi:bleomycin hydrolase
MASGTVSPELLAKFRDTFDSDQKNRLAQSFVMQHGIHSGCKSSNHVPSKVVHSFNTKVSDKSPHASPVTDQKGTGRCWMFAILNVIRLPFIKKYELGEFEFSQSFLFFWDKIERANYFLHAYIETRNEDMRSRLCSWLVQDPFSDGGQWDMLVNLVTKYGIVPKEVYPETKSLESSRALNALITNKVSTSWYCTTLPPCRLKRRGI